MKKDSLINAKDKMSKFAKKGMVKGAIGMSLLGGVTGLTSCEKGDVLDEMHQEKGTFEINDANINDFKSMGTANEQNIQQYKHVKIVVNDPANVDKSINMALNLIRFGHKENVNVDLIIGSANTFRFTDRVNGLLGTVAFENLARCVSASNFKFVGAYNNDFDSQRVSYADDLKYTQLPASTNLNFSCGFNTIDLTNMGHYVKQGSSMKALVDMVQILEATGFKVSGLKEFPRLQEALTESTNPYKSKKMSKGTLYLNSQMFSNEGR